MGDFSADLDVLRRGTARYAQLATDTVAARRYVDSHDLPAGGGLAGLILSRHARIPGDVDTVLFTAQNILEDFSEDFEDSYRAYRTGDEDSDDDFRRIWSEVTLDPDGTSHPAQFPPGSPSTRDLGHTLPSAAMAEPRPPDTAITVMATIDAVVDATARFSMQSASFRSWFTYITGIDLDSTLNRIIDDVVGDWQAVGLLADLYRNYGEWFAGAGVAVRDSAAVVGLWWQGDAATYACTQLTRFGYELFLTESDIDSISQRYLAACLGIYGLIDDLAAALTGLLDKGSEVQDTLTLIDPDAPVPVIVGQIIGSVIDVASQLNKTVAIYLLVIKAVKYVLEILAVLQAAFATVHNRLPSRA